MNHRHAPKTRSAARYLDAVSLPAVLLGMTFAGAGCFGPPALESSVLGYDETTAGLEQKLLLLNVARWDAGLPVHFTTTSSIAATFDWSTSAGVGGRLNEGGGNWLDLNWNVSGSENPTFSITPVTGEAFTKRVLRPLRDEIFNSMVFQGDRLDQVMRLMADGIEVQNADGSFVRFIANRPSLPEEYEEFRRIALHLRALQRQEKLFIRSLVFEETLIADFDGVPPAKEINIGFANGMTWKQKPDGRYMLTRLTAGRVVVTNYDPRAMTNEALYDLNSHIQYLPPSFVHLDIRADGPGGEMPIRGAISLRSLVRILDFVARGIHKAPEFDVARDERTPDVGDSNPTYALRINATDSKPDAATSIFYNDHYYSVADTDWDRSAFRLLTWLFQAALGDVQSPGIPITIAK